MTAEVEKKVEEIKRLFEAYKTLKGLENTESACGELEETIIEAARELAEMYEEEEDEDSWYGDLKAVCEAYNQLDMLCYKWDSELSNKYLEMRRSIQGFIFELAGKIAEDEG